MPKTVAELLIGRLIKWGVDTIFGFHGDGVKGIFDVLTTKPQSDIGCMHPRTCANANRER